MSPFTFTLRFFLPAFLFWLRWVFVAARGLSLVVVSGGYSVVVVQGLLIVMASPVAEHRLYSTVPVVY